MGKNYIKPVTMAMHVAADCLAEFSFGNVGGTTNRFNAKGNDPFGDWDDNE